MLQEYQDMAVIEIKNMNDKERLMNAPCSGSSPAISLLGAAVELWIIFRRLIEYRLAKESNWLAKAMSERGGRKRSCQWLVFMMSSMFHRFFLPLDPRLQNMNYKAETQ